MFVRELNCLFFHIPKAAGTSIEQWLIGGELDVDIPDYERLFGWERVGDFNLQHATPAMARQFIGTEVFDACFRFAIVRNPYARAVSAYHYVFEQCQQQFGGFEAYIRALPTLIQSANPRMRRHEHHLPQVDYVRLDGVSCCHELIRFEQLPESLQPVAKRLGITRSLPFANAYRHPSRGYRPVSSFYTPESARLLAEVYAEDFETFGYSTELEAADEAKLV